jgi:RNA polymerase sigma-70 factor (ECF subfamily)
MTVAEYNKSIDDYSDRIFRFILKNLKNEEKARDVVQDTYEKLWLRIEDVTASKVRSYLFAAAYHTMIDLIRKEGRNTRFESEKYDVPADNMSYSGLNEILNEAISRLPEDQRSVIMLRDYEGYAYDEIASITGLSESQVKVYIFRGRMFLRNYIGSIESVI